jgi:hypothetical protein
MVRHGHWRVLQGRRNTVILSQRWPGDWWWRRTCANGAPPTGSISLKGVRLCSFVVLRLY